MKEREANIAHTVLLGFSRRATGMNLKAMELFYDFAPILGKKT
jgi:hypothetical protein